MISRSKESSWQLFYFSLQHLECKNLLLLSFMTVNEEFCFLFLHICLDNKKQLRRMSLCALGNSDEHFFKQISNAIEKKNTNNVLLQC